MEAEFFLWWIAEEGTGERRLTTYKLSRIDAERACPGAEPDLQTRELRRLRNPDLAPPTSRPGTPWA